ncbi:MAG TPA: hypothetical protein VHH36_08955, partial [Candidatus Thermoplasmatota archaeon]|nr:hypothetical protein [Candidatus Thermoplasmatota archaeon]
RGADRDEVGVAAAASFAAGMGTLVVAAALAGGLWTLLAAGLPDAAPPAMPRGVPALALAAALAVAAWALSKGRVPAPRVRRPSKAAAGRAAPARSRARKSPS